MPTNCDGDCEYQNTIGKLTYYMFRIDRVSPHCLNLYAKKHAAIRLPINLILIRDEKLDFATRD